MVIILRLSESRNPVQACILLNQILCRSTQVKESSRTRIMYVHKFNAVALCPVICDIAGTISSRESSRLGTADGWCSTVWQQSTVFLLIELTGQDLFVAQDWMDD